MRSPRWVQGSSGILSTWCGPRGSEAAGTRLANNTAFVGWAQANPARPRAFSPSLAGGRPARHSFQARDERRERRCLRTDVLHLPRPLILATAHLHAMGFQEVSCHGCFDREIHVLRKVARQSCGLENVHLAHDDSENTSALIQYRAATVPGLDRGRNL